MKKNQITKLVNVFQEKYTNNIYCHGLGDYIRGSICLLQYATMQQLDFCMYYDTHPIASFLENKDIVSDDNIESNSLSLIHPYRVFFYNTDDHPHSNTLPNIQKKFTNIIHNNPGSIQTSAFTLYTNMFPAKPIMEYHKMRIRNALCPNLLMQDKINLCMSEMHISTNKYNVIHIRTGDEYLIHHGKLPFPKAMVECKRSFLQVFTEYELTNGKKEKNIELDVEETFPFVLISDNDELKKQLKRAMPNLIVKHHPISHMGENSLNMEDKDEVNTTVANTLVDFFIISKANAVYSFSTLGHGTGFSEQCCQIHNIQYSSYRFNFD